ncbi:enzymatic polyprotein endonuclease reverse, partial [Aduncisulcus paluster]
LKDRKIIKKSSTSYHCATVIVPKKNNKLRLCVDYRPLNEITVGMGQVLPRIGDLFGAMGGMKFFAVLDLTAGYHQIPVEKSSQKYTSFVTEFGQFEYTRMPFGMKNAPPFFQETMNRVLTGLVNIICCVYLDDIVVFAMDMPSLIVRLIAVFMRLNGHNMKVNLEKTVIGAQEVEFLGFMISGFGIRRSPKKLKALKRMSVLKNKQDVRSFLGMASYLRSYIPKYAEITEPLRVLTLRTATFKWTMPERKAVNRVIKELEQGICLEHVRDNANLHLFTDASDVGVGGALVQFEKDDVELKKPGVICFVSKSL